MNEDEINSAVAEFGTPQYCETDDGESGFWQFDEDDTLTADSIGQLLSAGVSLISVRAKMSRLNEAARKSRERS